MGSQTEKGTTEVQRGATKFWMRAGRCALGRRRTVSVCLGSKSAKRDASLTRECKAGRFAYARVQSGTLRLRESTKRDASLTREYKAGRFAYFTYSFDNVADGNYMIDHVIDN